MAVFYQVAMKYLVLFCYNEFILTIFWQMQVKYLKEVVSITNLLKVIAWASQWCFLKSLRIQEIRFET